MFRKRTKIIHIKTITCSQRLKSLASKPTETQHSLNLSSLNMNWHVESTSAFTRVSPTYFNQAFSAASSPCHYTHCNTFHTKYTVYHLTAVSNSTAVLNLTAVPLPLPLCCHCSIRYTNANISNCIIHWDPIGLSVATSVVLWSGLVICLPYRQT